MPPSPCQDFKNPGQRVMDQRSRSQLSVIITKGEELIEMK